MACTDTAGGQLTWGSCCHQLLRSSVSLTRHNNNRRLCRSSSAGSHCKIEQTLASSYYRVFQLIGNNFSEKIPRQGRVDEEGRVDAAVA